MTGNGNGNGNTKWIALSAALATLCVSVTIAWLSAAFGGHQYDRDQQFIKSSLQANANSIASVGDTVRQLELTQQHQQDQLDTLLGRRSRP